MGPGAQPPFRLPCLAAHTKEALWPNSDSCSDRLQSRHQHTARKALPEQLEDLNSESITGVKPKAMPVGFAGGLVPGDNAEHRPAVTIAQVGTFTVCMSNLLHLPAHGCWRDQAPSAVTAVCPGSCCHARRVPIVPSF